MSQQTHTGTDFDSWVARAALEAALAEVLARPDVSEVVAAEGLSNRMIIAELLDNDSLLTRIRAEQDQLVVRFGVNLSEGAYENPFPFRSLSPRDIAWLVFIFSLGVGYISLLRASFAAMPLLLRAYVVVGLVAMAAISIRLVGRKVPVLAEWLGFTSKWEVRPEEIWVQLGVRRRRLLSMVVLPEVRQYISDNRKFRYGTVLESDESTTLPVEDDDGARDEIVVTAAAQRLQRVIRRSGSEAVALAGNRGVGKTTAIQSAARGLFSDPDSPLPLAVVASAPARYDARDFVLYLHALLCKAVIAEIDGYTHPEHSADPYRYYHAKPQPSRVDRTFRRVSQAIGRGLRLILIIGISTATAAWLWSAPPDQFLSEVIRLATVATDAFPRSLESLLADQPAGHIIALAIMVVLATNLAFTALRIVFGPVFWLVKLVRGHSQRLDDGDLGLLRAAAESQLGRIRFLQTYTTGWSGKISAPLSTEAGWSRSLQRAEQQLTHPEVVEEFRRFAEHSAKVLKSEGLAGGVLIAIDELDKIGQPEKAHEFVNDIKGVFGIPGCLFLVSVSDDAITAFERRGIAVRDAFDSSFSEMLRLDPFTLDESRRWISRRVLKLSEQFIHLCHCLSGGLPRDLRRCTVEMLDIAHENDNPSLETVAEVLVRQELDRKAHAFSGAARMLEDEADLPGFMAELLSLTTFRDTEQMLECAVRLVRPGEDGDATPLRRLRWQSGCFVLLCATIREVFTNELSEQQLSREHTDPASLNRLATARQQLGVEPQVAWRVLTDFRRAYGLGVPQEEPGE